MQLLAFIFIISLPLLSPPVVFPSQFNKERIYGASAVKEIAVAEGGRSLLAYVLGNVMFH